MQLLQMPKGVHQCLVYSLAMLIEEDPDVIIAEIGHDGTEAWWDYGPPYSYRGYHIQEIIDVCLLRGIGLTPIEATPLLGCAMQPGSHRQVWPPEEAQARMHNILQGRPAILIGPGHACAWDGNIVFDPNGRNMPLSEFRPMEAWLVSPSHQKGVI